MTLFRSLRPMLLTAAVLLLARPALAGPPLLCFPFEIGAAKSLPVGTGGWESTDPRYDASQVVEDTLALLTPQTPIIVRMETLRRATLYAAKKPGLANALLDRLQERAAIANANAPLAMFDFGYLAETYKQANHLFGGPMKAAQTIDGHNLVMKAAAFRNDPEVEFALAVMTRGNTQTRDEFRGHVTNVLKAAPNNPAIAANIDRQFGAEIASDSSLRSLR